MGNLKDKIQTIRKLVEGEKALPPVSRLDMSFKDVTKRMPELQQAAKLYEQGKITREQYYAIIDKLKPVLPYEFIPKPATAEEALAALTSNKAKDFGRTDLLTPGETIMSRLDIPAYSQKGTWVTSQHRLKPPADEPKTIYTPTMMLEGETKMMPGTKAARKVAKGEEDKSSFATIRGAYKPGSDEEAVERAIEALRSKDYAQIGYDPERRGFFYDRRTMEPIIGTEEGIIQIGPLVLGKKPIRGKPEDFEYKDGGAVHMQDGGSPLDQFAAKSRGVSSLPGYGEGAQDIQQALAAIQEGPVGRIASGVGELAEGYMSGAGSTDLQKIGQGLSMVPMLGLPATVSKTIKTARVGDAITDSLRAKYPNVDISVAGDNTLYLGKMVVPKEQRNQGIGTQVMNDLVKQADDIGATVTLSPSADFGGNKEKLKEFYKRFGFVQNTGKNKDFAISESMYRTPQENLPTNFSDLGAMATQAYADYKANPNQLNALRYQRIKKAADDAYVKTQATPSKPVVTNEDYRGLHTAPTRAGGAPLHDLTQTYPDDIYSSRASQYYGHGEPRDAAVVSLAQSFKGRPHQMVTVYRAVPKNAKGSINAGDWVTIDRPYAKSHGESALRGDYKILSKRVRANEIFTNGDSIYEWGYDPVEAIKKAAGGAVSMQNNRKVRISDNPDTMLLELMNAPRMQAGGKPPPGVRRAMAQQRGTVAPIPGIKTPAEFIGGYVGADPRFSVMDPDAEALERAYRAGEATSVIGDIVGSISPFATASTLARANALPGAAVVKGAAKKAFTARELKSETNKVAKAIAKDNPKMKPEDVQKRAATIAEKNLTWTKEQKPELEKTYGQLVQAPASASVGERLQNVPEVVSQRAKKAEEFLAQPTEPWQPPRPELQAFDRAMIKDAMEGFPGIEQTAFPRYTPPKADLSYIEEIYQDPRNRALIESQIKRGLPLGGETFYASLYPMKMAALERGIPEEKFNQFIYSTAPASARNSIMNEMAVGQFLRDMNARGLPLDEETVKREMAAFKEKYGKGLPLMPIHREGVKNVLEGNLDLREQLKADIPINYKVPTYGTQKAGDFGKSVVLDVHEAAGQTQGSRFHPYFSEQGGFGSREYGAAEQQMMDIAKGLGLPGGTAQAGRWFGGGELTGLV